MDEYKNILMSQIEVLEFCHMKKSTMYNKIKSGTFPAPYKIGERLARWKKSDLITWMDNLSCK